MLHGQEIYIFFYRFGINGLIGIFICSIIIGFIIYKTLCISFKYKIKEYEKFLNHLFKNKKLSKAMNIIINIFLCVTFFIMTAGFSTYIYEQFGINKLITSTILAIITYYVFIKNIDSITKINSVIIPILIITIIIIGIKNISNIQKYELKLNTGIGWVIEAIVYSSYNIILLIPVLINLNKYIKNKKQILKISIFSGIIIFIISTCTFFLFTNIDKNIKNIEMPVIYVIENKFTNFKMIYGVVILIAIFTTEISSGISFLNNICKKRERFSQISAILCITSIAISKIKFSSLVNILFPIFGYLGLIQIYFISKSK